MEEATIESIADELSQIRRDAIIKIGDTGEDGLTTFGWAVNWFSVYFLNQAHPELFTGFAEDEDRIARRVKLTPVGRALYEHLRDTAP